ncbi:hypothetical protein THOB06_320047 [Vibrio rotiferianus]|nr:hypothetical protein THOE12_230046 [Vibrio rotiferianus]CAH1582891.1 hypothetical protein THOG10_320047 [Vibrio rotiferianus]CAH1584990.1 hypothetical protein THOB06_320047 [Vibrio rotiferianus]
MNPLILRELGTIAMSKKSYPLDIAIVPSIGIGTKEVLQGTLQH